MSSSGSLPLIMYRKLAAVLRSSLGSSGLMPFLLRFHAATIVGMQAMILTAFLRLASRDSSPRSGQWPAISAVPACRTLMGGVSSGSLRIQADISSGSLRHWAMPVQNSLSRLAVGIRPVMSR